MTEISQELAQRMADHLRKCAAETIRKPNALHVEMLAIVADLPKTVDPEVIEARELVAKCCKWFVANSDGCAGMVSNILDGSWDNSPSELVSSIANSIRRGKALGRQDNLGGGGI
jgi:hypothetical protein